MAMGIKVISDTDQPVDENNNGNDGDNGIGRWVDEWMWVDWCPNLWSLPSN